MNWTRLDVPVSPFSFVEIFAMYSKPMLVFEVAL